jgi:ACS family sodium-dependent inorganic phosphate cotransporter-like MFS transporter 6/7/8
MQYLSPPHRPPKESANETHKSNVTTLGPKEIQFKWSVAMESAVDSSFFWGYLVTQIPGGFLASVYPANRIFGTAIACSAFLNLFLPGAFEFPGVIICIRVLQGLVEVGAAPSPSPSSSFLLVPIEL